MKNSDYIQNAYDEIQTPEALFGKVMNMNKKKLKVKNVLKHAAIAFSAFAVLFAASNTICYAATGETLIDKAIVYINGELYTEADINWTQNGDTLVGEISLPDSDITIVQPIEMPNENGEVVVEDVQIEVDDSSVNLYLIDDTTTPRNDVPTLENRDGRIYLILADEMVDITEDFADGTATGEIIYDDMIYIYTVSGDIEIHDITLEAK